MQHTTDLCCVTHCMYLQENEYMYAIRTVGSVLAPYDTDQRYTCFGFGAKLPPYSQVSHCFALNGNENDPEVTGVDVSYSHTHCVLMLSNLYIHA